MVEGWGDNFEQARFIDALEFGTENAIRIVRQIQSTNLRTAKKTDSKSVITSSPSFLDNPFQQESYENNATAEIDGAETKEAVQAEEAAKSSSKLDLNEMFQKLAHAKIYDVLTDYEHDKKSRDNALNQIRNSVINVMLKNPQIASDPNLNYTTLSEQFYKVIFS